MQENYTKADRRTKYQKLENQLTLKAQNISEVTAAMRSIVYTCSRLTNKEIKMEMEMNITVITTTT